MRFPKGAVCLVLSKDGGIGAPGALLWDAEFRAGLGLSLWSWKSWPPARAPRQNRIPKLVAAPPVRGFGTQKKVALTECSLSQ